MMTALLAFVWGLIAIGGIVNCDVSHLRRQNQFSQQSGQTFVANNGQFVKQSYNSNGNPTFSSRTYNNNNGGNNLDQNKNYWWLRDTRNVAAEPSTQYNTQKSSVSNYFSASGCNGCASQKVNLNRHNTQKHTNNRQQQNSFTNVRNSQQQKNSFNQRQTASVSGSSAVNNFGQNFDSGRIQQQSNCDSNSACVAPNSCKSGSIDSSAESKAVRSSSGRCYAPEVCCRFSSSRRSAQYQDNSVSEARGTSEVLTKEGYVVNKPSNQYLPSYNDAPSNVNPTRVPGPSQPPRQQPPRPQPPRPQQPQRPNPPPYQPQPTNNRPVVQYDPAPIVIPVGCSAAMNCTNVQYCTQSGVISKTPVTLSPQQEMFRVPLTDCRNPETKEVGKCCRDPDYVDPWPVGRTGQYVPEELNAAFNSGAYKPEQSKTVPVRVRAKEDGYVLPQPSVNQQRLYLPPNRI